MKRIKVILRSIAILAIVTVATFNVNLLNKSDDLSEISLESVAAYGFDIEEWWNRPDYSCVSVTCQAILYTYPSTVAEYKGEGKGSVAHTWNCSGCNGNGWTVD
jgi:hypothetical protein